MSCHLYMLSVVILNETFLMASLHADSFIFSISTFFLKFLKMPGYIFLSPECQVKLRKKVVELMKVSMNQRMIHLNSVLLFKLAISIFLDYSLRVYL